MLFASRFFVVGTIPFKHDFTAVFPVLRIAAAAEIVRPSINGTCPAGTVPEIVDCLTLDHVSAFSAADSVMDDLIILHLPLSV